MTHSPTQFHNPLVTLGYLHVILCPYKWRIFTLKLQAQKTHNLSQGTGLHHFAGVNGQNWCLLPTTQAKKPGFSLPGLNCVTSLQAEAQSTDSVFSATGSHTDPQVWVAPAQLSEGGSEDRGDVWDTPHTQQQQALFQGGLNVDLLVFLHPNVCKQCMCLCTCVL